MRLREDCGRESFCFTSSVPELSGIGQWGGGIQQKPCVHDGRGRWVTKGSQREQRRKRGPGKLLVGVTPGWVDRLVTSRPHFRGRLRAITLALGEGPWEENRAAHRQQSEGGTTVGLLGLL